MTDPTPLIWANLPISTYRFSGDDARDFLQGQITQDINLVKPGDCRYAAYCTPKGKMLATLLVYAADNDIVLCLHRQVADSVIKRLQMFVLRSQVKIHPQDYRVLGMSAAMLDALCRREGLTPPAEFASIEIGDGLLISLPNAYAELHLPNDSEQAQAIVEYLHSLTQPNLDAVEQLRLQGGHFHILPTTTELLLPQQTPLAKWGGISYQKGCYVGQEVIARDKYLGKVKKVLAVATFDGQCPEAAGKVYDDDGRAVGKVIAAQAVGKHVVCLAVIPLSQLQKHCRLEDEEVMFQPVAGDMPA